MSQEVKQYIIKSNRKHEIKDLLYDTAILLIISIVLAFIVGWRIILFVPILILIVAFSGTVLKDKKRIIPDTITIDEENMIAQSTQFCVLKSTSDVKTIIDYGDCYVFHFATLPFVFSFVCQKDLITKGTIEDFENFFKDKIQRAGKTGDGGVS